MDDDDLIKVALRAALDHILEMDGEHPLTDSEWEERPQADPKLFATLVSAGHAALDTARAHGAEIDRALPSWQLRIAHVKKTGGVRVQHIPTGTVIEVSSEAPRVDPTLAVRMVRAAFEPRT